MERYEEALADFDKAIALNENYTWALARRGETYQALKRYEEAISDFNRAIALDEENAWNWYNQALLHFLMGQRDAYHADLSIAIHVAQDELKHLSEPQKDYYLLRFNLALYLLADGSPEAEDEYERLLSACSIVARLRAAANDLREFLAVQPGHELAQGMLNRIEARIKELA